MSVTDFNTWNPVLHVQVMQGGLTAEELLQRTLDITYVDRAVQFDHIEWNVDNRDGYFTRPEHLATGVVVMIKLGYLDGTFPWKAFILNRLRGGVGVYGRSDPPLGDNERKITLHGRNRNAPGGKRGKPWSGNAKPPRKHPERIYGPTRDVTSNELYLDGSDKPAIVTGQSTSAIVRSIAYRNGFNAATALIEDTYDQVDLGGLVQRSMSDGQYLGMLARKFRFVFCVEDGVLHWHSPHWKGLQHNIVEHLTYGAGTDVNKIDIDVDFRLPQPTKVTPKSYDRRNRVMQFHDLTFEEARRVVNMGVAVEALLQDDALNGLITRTETGISVGGKGTLTRQAISRFVESNWRAFQLNAETVGNPRLLAKRLITLDGTGSPFVDATWFISEARHRLKPGDYRTDLHLKHPPKQGKLGARNVVGQAQDRTFEESRRVTNQATMVYREYRQMEAPTRLSR